jgi:hypothetical protein
MSIFAVPLLFSLAAAPDEPPAPKLPLGKDTTYVTAPLDKDGYIDYEAALNDRLAAGVTPETNANVLIMKALGPKPEGGRMPPEYYKRLGIDEPPLDGDYFVSLGRFLRDQFGSGQFDEIYDQETQAARRPWAAKDYPAIAAWLKASQKPLDLIAEATRRPEYYNPLVTRLRNGKERGSLIGALLPTVQRCREAAAALAARAMLRVQEGKFGDAWQDLLACHRLGRLIARGGTVIEALVGLAIDTIAGRADLAYLERADLTAAQALDRMKDLRGLPPMPPLADKIDLCERFLFLDSAELVRRGGVDALDAFARGSVPEGPDADAEKKLTGMDWVPVLRNGNAWFDRLAAAMRLQDRTERDKELDRIDRDLQALKPATSRPWIVSYILLGKDPADKKAGKIVEDALIALLMPAVRKVQNAHDRDEQAQRNLQVAFALAAYHADHGTYPMKLGDLAPQYLTAVPDDLFAGGPLVYHPWVKGYTLYSVGVNGQDDGGQSYDDDPPGDDLPVTMPLPELKTKK